MVSAGVILALVSLGVIKSAETPTFVWFITNNILYCLEPPYSYLIIYAIILSIVVSSRFHRQNHSLSADETALISTLLVEYSTAEAMCENEDHRLILEKPLVCSRFGPNKSSAEGVKVLRVAKPNKEEMVENAWKMITDGRHMPLTRHRHLKKSAVLKDRTNFEWTGSRIRREPSLSQEELNRRVEAFIKKFNEDIRLQRKQSLKRYMEMINA
ncbi:uncharacterized protein [Henckelia pumila]|uniref:uncharacterized protein n=1 Tax=Henckelia pumila TaxID=405737 RepID=UPI003C6EA318